MAPGDGSCCSSGGIHGLGLRSREMAPRLFPWTARNPRYKSGKLNRAQGFGALLKTRAQDPRVLKGCPHPATRTEENSVARALLSPGAARRAGPVAEGHQSLQKGSETLSSYCFLFTGRETEAR